MSELGTPGTFNKMGKRGSKTGSNRSQLSSQVIKHSPSKPHRALARNSLRNHKDFRHVKEGRRAWISWRQVWRGSLTSGWDCTKGWAGGLEVTSTTAWNKAREWDVSQSRGAGRVHRTALSAYSRELLSWHLRQPISTFFFYVKWHFPWHKHTTCSMPKIW